MLSDAVEDVADRLADGFDAAPCSLSQPVLELGEELLDRIEVGRVFRQEEALGAGLSDGRPHGLALVRAEIVHDDDVAGLEGGHEHGLDIEAEALAVDRPVDEPWRGDGIVAQCSQERHGLPVAVLHLGLDAFPDRRPAVERRHVGLGPGLVDEHQAGRIDAVLIEKPLRPPARHVWTLLLGRDQRLFLSDRPSACTNSHAER